MIIISANNRAWIQDTLVSCRSSPLFLLAGPQISVGAVQLGKRSPLSSDSLALKHTHIIAHAPPNNPNPPSAGKHSPYLHDLHTLIIPQPIDSIFPPNLPPPLGSPPVQHLGQSLSACAFAVASIFPHPDDPESNGCKEARLPGSTTSKWPHSHAAAAAPRRFATSCTSQSSTNGPASKRMPLHLNHPTPLVIVLKSLRYLDTHPHVTSTVTSSPGNLPYLL